jgi:hypothetical protein
MEWEVTRWNIPGHGIYWPIQVWNKSRGAMFPSAQDSGFNHSCPLNKYLRRSWAREIIAEIKKVADKPVRYPRMVFCHAEVSAIDDSRASSIQCAGD